MKVKWIIFSVAVHAIGFLVWKRPWPLSLRERTTPVEIQWKESKPVVNLGPSRRARGSHAHASSKALKKITLAQALDVSYRRERFYDREEGQDASAGSAGEGYGDTAVDLGAVTTSSMRSALMWLYRFIDSRLDFPPELIEYERFGYVIIEASIDENLKLRDPGIELIAADDRILKVYVLRLLDDVFREAVPQSFHLPKPLRLRMKFTFYDAYASSGSPDFKDMEGREFDFLRSSKKRSMVSAYQSKQGRDRGTDVGVGINMLEAYGAVAVGVFTPPSGCRFALLSPVEIPLLSWASLTLRP